MLRFEDLPEVNSERWLSLEDFEGEVWKDIDVAKGAFMISNYGRVKALARFRANRFSGKMWVERIRRLGYSKKGYPAISLTVSCKRVFVGAVHRLVANAFIPNDDKKPQIDHINTIKTDNRSCNLRWVTNKENADNPITRQRVHEINSRTGIRQHSEETKNKLSLAKIGKKNPRFGKTGKDATRSIPVVQLTLKGEYLREWDSIRDAYKQFRGHIGSCCRGERKSAAGYKWKYKSDYY